MIRMGHPLAFAGLLDHIGASVEGYFRRQKLPTLCKDPNAYVPLRMAWGLFYDAARREDQYFGWHVGRFVGDHLMNAAVLKRLDSAPTLYGGLKRLVRLISAEASHLQIGILERCLDVLLYTHYPGVGDEPGYNESQTYQLELYIDLIRHFAGASWSPTEIGIEAPNAPAFLGDHFAASRIKINQPFGYLAIPRLDLSRKLRTIHWEADGNAPLVAPRQLDYADTLSLLLKPYLLNGYPNMRFAAELMDTSTRTLMRRLNACGAGYQSLVDNTRFQKSRDLLLKTDRSIMGIACSVGFTDQANFTRWFRRVAGTTPSEFRGAVFSALN